VGVGEKMVQIDKKIVTEFIEEKEVNFELYYNNAFFYKIAQLLIQGVEEKDLFMLISNLCFINQEYIDRVIEMEMNSNRPYVIKTNGMN
jgi:hypothetical protein